ncbi:MULTISPECIES: DNA-processing protein DprA [unclassified Nitrosomonas]|uniref:DNA-processing protein DprA n=1 Tax=unclassified Nitrosomonas TaxID=2609265 RepID=UPI000898CCEC|nr:MULTISPECIES: DNA-processing protein DprA [unclassified Nitrosomonas]MDV6344365.1 DNA-processing protein DprA [Nitrosomonas sp. Is37]SDX87975.1 DNA processing protein [Nitrosomonas sp. Nm33]
MKAPPDVESWLNLTLIDSLGDESIRKLLIAFGNPREILSTDTYQLERIVKKQAAYNITRGADKSKVDAALKWLEDPSNCVITLADHDYPKLLLNIVDPPPLFYLKGQRKLLNSPTLAIVGSRNATPQGIANAGAFAEAASNAGFCIVSGMAQGIDTAAHQGGLRGISASIAVVGTGLDIVYPARNRELAHLLAKEGALISEFPLGMPALGRNFPRRNRIISGMSLGCLVVEATLHSGSLITAKQALEQGREVMAIPGSIHSPLSKGCHALIKQGAKLIENIQDILDEFNCQTALPHGNTDVTLDFSNSQGNSILLPHLGYDVTDIDTLCTRSGLTVEAVSAMLLALELNGMVASLPGGRYQRVR